MHCNIAKNTLIKSHISTHTIVKKSQQFLVLVVSDEGVGIDEKHIPHLTEQFYLVDKSRQRKTGGFGLGLYIIKMIVKAHNGELIIHSQLNVGTTVTVTLPIE